MLGDVNLPEQLHAVIELYWQRLGVHESFTSLQLGELIATEPKFTQELTAVWIASDFVANAMIADPSLIKLVFERRLSRSTNYYLRLDPTLAPLRDLDFNSGSDQLKSRLRQFYRLEFILIIWRDICGYDEVSQVCRKMSELAEASLQGALNLLHDWSMAEWGNPMGSGSPQSLVIIGMGKLGAIELNVSSDIDLIFAFQIQDMQI